MISRLRILFVSLLAVVTAVYVYRFLAGNGLEALLEWRGRWVVVLLCAGLNCTGILLDFICWRWMYRRCGIPVAGFTGAVVFLSVFAAQLMPMQTGRLVRPDACQRLGLGSVRRGIEAETALLYLDLAGVAMLIGLLVAWLAFPPAAPLVAALVVVAALGAARVLSQWLGEHLAALRPVLFWGWQGVATVLLRAADRALLGLALFLLIRPFVPGVHYANAALNALAADTLGVLSGMPGGLGVAEPVLGWLLKMAELPEAQIVIAVAVFRIITFWGVLPVAWIALTYVELIKPAKETVDERPAHEE